MRPFRYFVEWEDAEAVAEIEARGEEPDPVETSRRADFSDLARAKRFAAKKDGVVVERKNIRDATPDGDPPGILWDWDDETAWEGGR